MKYLILTFSFFALLSCEGNKVLLGKSDENTDPDLALILDQFEEELAAKKIRYEYRGKGKGSVLDIEISQAQIINSNKKKVSLEIIEEAMKKSEKLGDYELVLVNFKNKDKGKDYFIKLERNFIYHLKEKRFID